MPRSSPTRAMLFASLVVLASFSVSSARPSAPRHPVDDNDEAGTARLRSVQLSGRSGDDFADRERRELHSSSSSSSSSHDVFDHDVACMLYDEAYETVVHGGGLLSGLVATDTCAMCWQQCGVFNTTVCPETCTSYDDLEDWCEDTEDHSGSGSRRNLHSNTGTGSSSSGDGTCHFQCIEYVTRCCPCGSETCLVDFRSSQTNGGAAGTFDVIAPLSWLEGTSAFPVDDARRVGGAFTNEAATGTVTPDSLIVPGDTGALGTLAGATAAPMTYGGSADILGTIAGEDNSYWGILYDGTVGLLFGGSTAAALGTEACGTVIFRSEDFLNGLGECGTRITKIAYSATSGTNVSPKELRLIINDSRGWHISDTASSTTSATSTLTSLGWKKYDIETNLDDHHAGTIGATTYPSYTCVKYVGARLCAETTAEITINTFEAYGLSAFKVYGYGPTVFN